MRLVILVVHLREGKGVWTDALQPNQRAEPRIRYFRVVRKVSPRWWLAEWLRVSHNIWEMGQILPDNRLAFRPRRVTRTIDSGMHAATRICTTTEHESLWGFAKLEVAEMCRNGTVRAPSQQIIPPIEAGKGTTHRQTGVQV